MNLSKENSEKALKTANRHRNCYILFDMYLEAGVNGLTDEEVMNSNKIHKNSCRPTRLNLEKMGRVVGTGKNRKSICNKDMQVYALVDHYPEKISEKIFDKNGFGDDYYETDHWKNFRSSYFERNPKECWVTGSTDGVMHLHHINYTCKFKETDNDVVCLSEGIHKTVEYLVDEGIPRSKAHLVLKEIRNPVVGGES